MFPPRLSHLATRSVVVAKLAPTYAKAHGLDDEEAHTRVEAGLKGPLLERLLDAAWEAMKGKTKRLDEQGLLEKVATTLADRPQRPGRTAQLSPAWSAFLILLDLEGGTATDSARKALETDAGRRMAQEGMAEAGRFLAAELTRGR
jgi:hypothetical protein